MMNLVQDSRKLVRVRGPRDGILVLGRSDVEKANTLCLYSLGYAMGNLVEALRSSPTLESMVESSVLARDNVETFASQPLILPQSKEAAEAVTSTIMGWFEELLDHEEISPKNRLPKEKVLEFNEAISRFQTIISSELPRANIYYVTPKRAYDTTILIEAGERVLPRDSIDKLTLSKEKVLKDVREATKCLALSNHTAVGFHIYRAIEAIITDEYFPLLEVDLPKNRNLGNYIKILKEKNVNDKITGILDHIKDNYRNPISHPEEFWGQEQAEGAFGLAVSVISIMIQDLVKLKTASIP